MNTAQPLLEATAVRRPGLGVGVALALLWAFHAAASAIPGRAYFYVVRLNDVSIPVQLNVLFEPAIVGAMATLIWRAASRRRAHTPTNKCGLVIGLSCWCLGATFSTIINAHVDQVVLTYWAVFASGAAIYIAIAGIEIAGRDMDVAMVGLAIGALFPLIGGVSAFGTEWGIPDAPTAVEAYKDLFRMAGYELATFGNRGNTAAFLVIITPMFLSISLDKHKPWVLRGVAVAVLIPVVMNLMILQVRAAFLTLALALVVVWGFKIGARRLPVLAAMIVVASVMIFRDDAGIGRKMAERLLPAVTLDTEDDLSVLERAESIKEGWAIAKRHWLLGIGPGAALTLHSATAAHQLQTHQAMELGILGLIGSTVFSLSVWGLLARTAWRGSDGGLNDTRFLLLIGPAAFTFYGVIANVTFNNGYVNTWTVLTISMLALAPGFKSSTSRRSELLLRSFGVPQRPGALWRPAHHPG